MQWDEITDAAAEVGLTFLFPLGNISKHIEKRFSGKVIAAVNRRYVNKD